MNDGAEALVMIVVWIVMIGLFWVLPITLGIKIAKKKGYSPHWMWFGIHPVPGWITVIVLACLQSKVPCMSCGGLMSSNFSLCPYCGTPRYGAPYGAPPPAAGPYGPAPGAPQYGASPSPYPQQYGAPPSAYPQQFGGAPQGPAAPGGVAQTGPGQGPPIQSVPPPGQSGSSPGQMAPPPGGPPQSDPPGQNPPPA